MFILLYTCLTIDPTPLATGLLANLGVGSLNHVLENTVGDSYHINHDPKKEL